MSITKGPIEGGRGGKKGHSNAERWGTHQEQKAAAKQLRRLDAKDQIRDQQNEMVKPSTRVAIVVKLDFGDRLFPLSRKRHVWIAETEANREAAARVWELSAEYKGNEGVTTFKVDEKTGPGAWALEILSIVAEHHDLQSDDVELEIIGTKATPAIRSALNAFELVDFQESAHGLIARRRLAF